MLRGHLETAARHQELQQRQGEGACEGRQGRDESLGQSEGKGRWQLCRIPVCLGGKKTGDDLPQNSDKDLNADQP